MRIKKQSLTYFPPFLFVFVVLAGIVASCGGDPGLTRSLTEAERIMEQRPDSALTILRGIDQARLSSKAQRARYALLISQAFDKNYIDTTSFDVIQPALDYYLEKGTPDEKLKTYYYQGRIFQNKEDFDNAMKCFVKALYAAAEGSDSLMIARVLVAQGTLCFQFCDFESYANCNLQAADIAKRLSRKDDEFSCLLNALHGTLLSSDKSRADSLLNLCAGFDSLDNVQRQSLLWYQLTYIRKYNSPSELKDFMNENKLIIESDVDNYLNLALAYDKSGDDRRAKELLDSIGASNLDYDTLKYQAISVSVLKGLGNFQEALATYEDFSKRMDLIDNIKLRHKLQLMEEKYRIELKAENNERKKSQIIMGFISGIVILALIIGILLLLVRSNRSQKALALQKARTSELENSQLKSEKENLTLENRNLQLERDKKALEAENLVHRVWMLENESESLKNLINAREELPDEVRTAIKVRIEMLNSLLASYITANDQYEKPYDAWVKELTADTEEFMTTNRLAFQASHPRFIQYFEDHGLTASEINYVCLYAIGLRGKEVGNYMKKRSHVNISSGIRKKLGIDKHETNIGIYVRKLLKTL